ncbi:MAG: PaaI family thioesterase [Planctomycetota bacterium]
MIDVDAVFERTQTNRLLGMRLLSRSPDRVEVELPVRPELLQEEGVVHGGLLSTLCDTAAVYLAWPELQPDRTMTSIEFKMNFLAAGLPDRGPVRAVATVLRRGSSVLVCESEAFQQDQRLCKGTFTYLVRDRRR